MPTFRFDNRIPVSSGDPITDIANLRTTMYELVENLHYMFGHLEQDNFGAGLSTYLSETAADVAKSLSIQVDVDGIVAEVRKEIGGDYEELSTKVSLTADGLDSVSKRVTTLENEKESDYDALRSEFRQTASEISSAVYSENITKSLDGYTKEEYVTSSINVLKGEINASISETLKSYSTNADVESIEKKLQSGIDANSRAISLRVTSEVFTNTLDGYSTKENTSSEIKASAESIASSVSKTYATINSVSDLSNNLSNNYYAKTTIDQKFDAIKLSVNVNGKEISLTLNGETQKINLAGYVTFTNLTVAGETVINGANIQTGTIDANSIKTGTLTADMIKGGTLSAVTISGNTITGGTINGATISGSTLYSEQTLNDGYKSRVEISQGGIAGMKYNPTNGLQAATGFLLDYAGLGLFNITNGLKTANFYVGDNGALNIESSGGIAFNGDVFPGEYNLSAFKNDLSLNSFNNNAIAMATAYMDTAGNTGGADISMTGITEKDSVGTFSRAQYSSSYGYGIKCALAGYYLISAHAVLKKTGTDTFENTMAIRKVTSSGTSSFLVRSSIYLNADTNISRTQDISPLVVYVEAGSFLSLYINNANMQTTAQGAHITAIYLGI